MMTFAKYTWCLFVGWLMRITFGLTPERCVRTRRDLVHARLQVDALKVARAQAREEATQLAKQVVTLRRELDEIVDVAFEKEEQAEALRAELARTKRLA